MTMMIFKEFINCEDVITINIANSLKDEGIEAAYPVTLSENLHNNLWHLSFNSIHNPLRIYEGMNLYIVDSVQVLKTGTVW